MKYFTSLFYLGILNVLIYTIEGYTALKMFLYIVQILVILLVINYEKYKKQKTKSSKIQR